MQQKHGPQDIRCPAGLKLYLYCRKNNYLCICLVANRSQDSSHFYDTFSEYFHRSGLSRFMNTEHTCIIFIIILTEQCVLLVITLEAGECTWVYYPESRATGKQKRGKKGKKENLKSG
jgi:hypothetical protein